MFTFDIWAPVGFVIALMVLPWLGRPFWCSFGRVWRSLYGRTWVAVGVVALVSLGVNGLVALHRGFPVPAVPDEFGYLLSADTFAHGRVTNPPHPLWPHFESEEIIQQPTYQAKYPPAQALFMAVGQVMTGRPAVGVFLSLSLACGALCWMLQAWVGKRWAFVGGLMAALSSGIVEGWGQSYWGGAVAFLGGALVFGGLRHLLNEIRTGSAVAMALGMALLANSRPFEGFLVSLLALGAGAWVWFRREARPPCALLLRKVLLPAAIVLIPTGGAMAFYNQRVTGNAFEMPYQVWFRTYVGGPGVIRSFLLHEKTIGKPPRTLVGSRPMKYKWSNPAAEQEKRDQQKRRVIPVNIGFYFPGLLGLGLLGLPWALKDRWLAFALGTVAVIFLVIFGGATICAPHYSAPVAALIFALLISGLRRLALFRARHRPLGRWLVRAVLLSFFVAALVPLTRGASVPPLALERQKILSALDRRPEKQLIIVRYDPTHQSTYEWVYNPADIDAAKVIWAREPWPKSDPRLVEYFKDRKLWLLDAETLELTPYSGPPAELSK